MNRTKNAFSVAFQLMSVRRFSRDHSARPESVLEHLGFATFYGALLVKRLTAHGYSVEAGVLFAKIAFHDVDEAMLGDIPRIAKYSSAEVRKEFAKSEEAAVRQLCDFLGEDILEEFRYAKLGNEGEVLRVIDIASVVYKNWIEINLLGNRSFLRVALETQGYLDDMLTNFALPPLAQELATLREINKSLLDLSAPTHQDRFFLRFDN